MTVSAVSSTTSVLQTSTTSSTESYDKMDTNKDGIVSETEREAYNKTHSTAAAGASESGESQQQKQKPLTSDDGTKGNNVNTSA